MHAIFEVLEIQYKIQSFKFHGQRIFQLKSNQTTNLQHTNSLNLNVFLFESYDDQQVFHNIPDFTIFTNTFTGAALQILLHHKTF
jgi:hypothetical protein